MWVKALARHACGGGSATPSPHWRVSVAVRAALPRVEATHPLACTSVVRQRERYDTDGARRSTARPITGHNVHTSGVIGRGRFRVSPLTGRVAPGAVAVSPHVAPLLPDYWSSSEYGFASSDPQWRGESPRVSYVHPFTSWKTSPQQTRASDLPSVSHQKHGTRRHGCSLLHT